MSDRRDWKPLCLAELNQAARARAVSNEGMARVCARRAAGFVIREFYRRRGEDPPVRSAIKLLQFISQDPSLVEEVRTAADAFTLVITHDHVLPVEVDLIDQVNVLAELLLGEQVKPAA